MAGLSSNPAFQRAMLRKRAQAIGGGQGFNTSDLTRQFAGDMMSRRLQFEGIADSERRAMTGISQQDRQLGLNKKYLGMAKKKLKGDKKQANLMKYIGGGGLILSGLEGRRRRGAVAEANARQAADRAATLEWMQGSEQRRLDQEKRYLGIGRLG